MPRGVFERGKKKELEIPHPAPQPEISGNIEETISKLIGPLVKSVADLANEVSILKNKASDPLTLPIEPLTNTVQDPTPVAPMTQETTKNPVPLEYRQVVDSVLNKSFGIRIVGINDRPSFELILVVPEKYQTLSEAYRAIYKEDLRPKVINYSDGTPGVRSWAEKVFESFSQDLKSLIVNDRVQGN